jgi:hypothetical protein
MELIDLHKTTDLFFELHWPSIADHPPRWSHPYSFVGALPNGDRCGCYALFKDDQLYYIGSGVSRGGGIYVNYGLGKRIGAHVIALDRSVNFPIHQRNYIFRSNWDGCTNIYTIGFPHEYKYLSLALEWYLISQLSPSGNTKGRST